MGLATFKIVAATAPRHHIYPQSLPCGARLLNWHAIAIADQLHLQAIQNLPVVVVTAMTATDSQPLGHRFSSPVLKMKVAAVLFWFTFLPEGPLSPNFMATHLK